jgi:hypothetical protein
MKISGRQFSTALINRIQGAIVQHPKISRSHLSVKVCTWLDWRAPNGKLQDMACRKALAKLNRRGLISLPEQQESFAFTQPGKQVFHFIPAELCCDLTELGEISVTPITSRYSKNSKVWRTLLDEHHYLGSGKLCGAQIRYIVTSSKYGHIGALSFSSGTWAMKDRDTFIGWSDTARIAHINQVLTNNRFLIVPTVQVKNLASHVLALVCSRLADDWEEKYAIRPVLVETFVDRARFHGTCYLAANWQAVGFTAGRRDGIKKQILLYPLCSDWQTGLCLEPRVTLKDSIEIEDPANWAEEEFGRVRLHDPRLKQRLCTIAQGFYNKPQANIPEACGTPAATVGAYRFFRNEKVSMDIILTAHTQATIERIRQHAVVLAPQDTSTLNYSHHPMTQGMGPIHGKGSTSAGLILHDTLAFTVDGTPLGVLDAQCWARDPEDRGKNERRKQLPIEEKESVKWLRSFGRVSEIQRLCPNTMLVSVGDREADIYELFSKVVQEKNGAQLLVRACKSRNRQIDQVGLWDYMSKQKPSGTMQIHIPHSGSKKPRSATVDVICTQVELRAPKRLHEQPDKIKVWAVHVIETKPDDTVKDPIDWMLLTTVPTNSFNDAKERVEWYAKRWGIEVYHRTLKTGCRIKDRQLDDADRIETCLAIDMVVAWRIFHLTMLGRETPEAPCSIFFSEEEWKALCCYVSKCPEPPPEPPTLQKAIRLLGAMGGHLGRKHDGPPGTETLWRGLQRLDTATEMFCIFHHINPSGNDPPPT